MKKKVTIFLVAIGILAMVGMFFLNKNKEMDVLGYEIKNTTYKDIISSIGTVEYDKQVQLKAEVSGTLLEIYGDVGDKIKAGELVARLDNKEGQIAYEEAKKNTALAKARQEDYMKSYYKNEESIEDQRLLQENEIASLKLQQSQLNKNRMDTKELVDKGALPAKDLMNLEDQMDTLTLKLEAANAKLEFLRAPILATQEIKASIDVANENVIKQQLKLTKYSVKTPIDGVVIDRLVEAGTFVQAGEVLMKIASDTEKYAVVEIDEKYISKVSIGKEAQISMEAYPEQTAKGIVESISPEVNKSSGTIELKVKIVDHKELFLQNMSVKVEFESQSYKNTIVIPGEYLVSGEESAVFVKGENGVALKKKIVVYNKNTKNIRVVEGLHAGDVILNPEKIKEGSHVNVILSKTGENGL